MQTHLLLKAFPTARVETRSEEKLIEREREGRRSLLAIYGAENMLWKLVNVLNFSFSFDRRNTLYFLDKSLFESYVIFEYLFLSFYVKQIINLKDLNIRIKKEYVSFFF